MSTCQLQPPNKALLAAQLVGLQGLQGVRRMARRLGYRRPRPLAESDLQAPDTAVARRARTLVETLSSVSLANHCHRSFVFALAIGRHQRRHFDAELLYIACMLHDLGLTESYRGPETFESRGADAARQFCVRQGVEPERADSVHEAISLHTSAMTAFDAPQNALLQLGAAADVIGYFLEDVAPGAIQFAVKSYPRCDFKRELEPLLVREAAQNPNMIMATQLRLGFARRIQRAPFAS